MTELPRQTYSVTVLGAQCEHSWPGTVTVTAEHTFALDRDDTYCPRCGQVAGNVMFGADDGEALSDWREG